MRAPKILSTAPPNIPDSSFEAYRLLWCFQALASAAIGGRDDSLSLAHASLIAVVAACSDTDAPQCAGLTPNYRSGLRDNQQGETIPNGYNAERPAWVLGPYNYNEDLIGGVPTQPRSRVAQGIF